MSTHTITTTAFVGEDHKVTLTLPEEVPMGNIELVVTATTQMPKSSRLGDLADFDFEGMWAEYPKEVSSETIARELRSKSWTRSSP